MRSSLLLLLFLTACSSKNENRKENLIGARIFRKQNDSFFSLVPPRPRDKKEYPWQEKFKGQITKEFFRCKGNPLNPPITGENKVVYRDCAGSDHHGLPLRDGKEFVYPCLIELLNFVQERTQKKVVITCGHRCPDHNTYCDHTPGNYGSKHMIGAEVDFYVVGMEREPEKVIVLLQEYYKEQKGYEKFERYEKSINVSTKPWYNKEIFIKLYLEHEGRDFDNQHGYPYIGVQVRYDRVRDKKITFDMKETRNYLRN